MSQWITLLPALLVALAGVLGLFNTRRVNELQAARDSAEIKLTDKEVKKTAAEIDSLQITNVTEAGRFVMALFDKVKLELAEANSKIAGLEQQMKDQAAMYQTRLLEQEAKYEARIAVLSSQISDQHAEIRRMLTPTKSAPVKRNTKPRRKRAA